MTFVSSLGEALYENALDMFKLFPSDLRDVITSYFYPIEKCQCDQSVEKIFFEDTTLNFFRFS